MNITLSANEKLIESARQYAREHGLTLNQMIRDYMEHLIGQENSAAAIEEFRSLARNQSGCSDEDFIFNRPAIHARRGKS